MTQRIPSPSAPPPPEPRRGVRPLLAVATGLLVFLGFAAYGMLAPTTFRATALVVLKPAEGKALTLPTVPPPVVRMRTVVVDPEGLGQAAAALKLGSGPDAQTRARAHLDAHLDVQSSELGTFEFSVLDPTAAGAERLTNLLARHAAARAMLALAPAAPDETGAREAARSKSAEELAAFLGQHPELIPAPAVVPVAPKDSGDPDASSLRAERDQIQARLARLPEPPPSKDDSDNPFGDGAAAAAEAKRMRRRISEIDSTLRNRQKAERKADAAPKIAPDVEREWKRLVQAVATPVVTPEAPTAPAFTVMLREAVQPTVPVEPNRRRIALLGGIGALLTALALLVLTALFGRRSPAVPVTTTARFASEPPRPGSEPPRAGGSEPPRPASEPPRYGSEPPRADGSEPPRPGSEPPVRPPSDPVRQTAFAATQAQPIVPIASTEVSGVDPRRNSSNPPPKPHSSNPPPKPQSSRPPTATLASSNPPLQPAPAQALHSPPPPKTAVGLAPPSPVPETTVGHGRPSPMPQTSVGMAPPSPLPPAPAPPPARPTPAYDGAFGQASGKAAVAKGTLVGMQPLDSRALEDALAQRRGEKPKGSEENPFDAVPGGREPDGPRSTLRPPPPDAPMKTIDTTAEVFDSHDDSGRSGQPAGDGATPPAEDQWTGPSRAHRRSQSARRTTQMLGSPIAPVVRGSRKPPEAPAPGGSSSAPPPAPVTTPTTYSYVSTRPEPPAQRVPADTPPYYQTSRGDESPRSRRPIPSPVAPAAAAPAPVPPARITKQQIRSGWTPDPSLDFRARRELSDQLFPLAVEGCFVVGVTAVDEARNQKSQVAAELALALAEARHPRVLLLEADFQWPGVHRTMRVEMPMSLGFSQQLSPKVGGDAHTWTVIQCSPTLHVLAEGIMRSPGLILSMRFEEAIMSFRTYYDFIVIDGPPASADVDCRALASAIDGAIVVSPRAGSPELGHACSLFPDKRFATVVGV